MKHILADAFLSTTQLCWNKITDMTQEDIEFSPMLKVRTKDGRKGYVHKSRLQLYSRHTDEQRKSILKSYNLPYINEYEWRWFI